MQELIKITTNESNEQLVSARELHEFLDIGTELRKWFPRMVGYGFIENVDYVRVSQKCPTLGGTQELVDYALKIDMAKEISMIQRNDKGKQARLYFIECERKLKEVATKQLPQDYINALKALVESEVLIFDYQRYAEGTIAEIGQIKGMKDMSKLILENIKDVDKIEQICREMIQKEVYIQCTDVRRTNIPEVGDRRSFGVNQYVYGVALDLTNGYGFLEWDEIIDNISSFK